MPTPGETADYIAALSEELSKMAAAASLGDLAGILLMATMEAHGGPDAYIKPKQKSTHKAA